MILPQITYRNKKYTILKFFFLFIFSTTIVSSTNANQAYANSGPAGSYTYYSFPEKELSDMTFTKTINVDPGKNSNVFWSSQFAFTKGNGGYTGMQTNGGDDRRFIFSIWDVTETRLGSSGSWCEPFGGEGIGMSCRIKHDWKEGETYEFRLAHEGDRWFGVTVTNKNNEKSFKIGSIRAASENLSGKSLINWVEHYEFGANCSNQPYSKATFFLPKANNNTINGSITSFKEKPNCPSRIVETASGSIHYNNGGQNDTDFGDDKIIGENPKDPLDPTEPKDPSEPNRPLNPTEPNDPIKPTDPTKPAKPDTTDIHNSDSDINLSSQDTNRLADTGANIALTVLATGVLLTGGILISFRKKIQKK